ncbi:transcription factor Sox-6 [Trichonephila clavipes]|nr:transcription factor Sox-6 [Trichonephila clavipes]
MILGLGKIDSAFHLFSGSVNEYQACLGTKPWGFSLETDHLIETSALAPQRPIVTCTEMGTIGLGSHGLRMSSKRKSPPTKFTPDDLSNGLHHHRASSDLLDTHHSHPFNTPPIPEVEENPLNLQQGSFDNDNRLTNEAQYTFDDDEEEHFLDNMTSSPGASDSCSPYPSRLADQDSDSVTSDPEGRSEGGALSNCGASSAFAHTSRKQRLLQSVSDSGKGLNPTESDSDSDPGCYSGSECGLSSNADQRLSSPGQSRTMEPVPSPGSSHHSDVGSGRPVNRRSMDDVVKKLTSKMHNSASLSETAQGLFPLDPISFQMDSSNRKQTNGDSAGGRRSERVLVENEDLKVTLSDNMSSVDKQRVLTDLINQLQQMKSRLEEQQLQENEPSTSLSCGKESAGKSPTVRLKRLGMAAASAGGPRLNLQGTPLPCVCI